jgi:hypothetical protein
MRKLILLTLVLVMLMPFGLSQAQEPTAGSKEDNACNEGGVMWSPDPDSGCQSEWAWNAGWYLARFLAGKLTRAQVPLIYQSVLPPLPLPSVAPVVAASTTGPTGPVAVCYNDGVGSFLYSGLGNVANNATSFSGTTCSTVGGPSLIVIAPDAATAATIWNGITGDSLTDLDMINMAVAGFNTPADFWYFT